MHPETPGREPTEPTAQFFTWAHLPPHLQEVSAPFGKLAAELIEKLPRNPERSVALRKLLEAKDAAVRAMIFKSLLFALAIGAILFAPGLALAADAASSAPGWLAPVLHYLIAPLVPLIGAALLAALAKLATYLHSREKQGKGAAALAVIADLMQSVVASIEGD